ncbi:MAG TPA: hypothetical protein VFD73_26390, partial [Gemmatimonadales bacterium]|nr:hypothetical protein [Gemmatimonadales bacterium]
CPEMTVVVSGQTGVACATVRRLASKRHLILEAPRTGREAEVIRWLSLRAPPLRRPTLVLGSFGSPHLPLSAEPRPARSKPRATTSPRPHFG